MGIATQILMSIQGQDQTGGAFSSVASRAAKASSGLRRAIGMATAGIGAALIVRSAKQAIDSMGTLSDQAQRVGTSAVYLQQLTAALDEVGIVGINMDSLAAAMGKMTKETGAVGAKGFEDSLAAISAIADEGPRVEKLTQVFGREMGAKIAPLVRQGPDAFRAGLRDVMAAMPAVTDAAVNSSDAVSDAMKRAGLTAQAAWRQVLGNIINWFGETFGMSLAEAMTLLTENIKWGVQVGWAYFHAFGANIGKVAAYFVEDWRGAVRWVYEGFKEVLIAIFNFHVQIFKSIGNVAVEFGKQLWSAIKGDGFDWSEFTSAAKAEFAKVGESGKELFKALKIEGNDKLKLEMPDMGDLLKQRRASIDTALKSLEAKAQLATGSVVEDTAERAVKAVRDAANNTFVEAGTYAALKLALSNSAQTTTGAGRIGGPAPVGGAGPSSGETGGGLMGALVSVAKNIETKLTQMELRMLRLEAI
jgi:cytochrome c556